MKDKFENDFSPIQTKLAGVSFGNCPENIRQWGCADVGFYQVIREPENPYDSNAVRVSFLGTYDMGYLPRRTAAFLAPLMDAGKSFLAEYICINEYAPYDTIGLTVRIVETKMQPFPLF